MNLVETWVNPPTTHQKSLTENKAMAIPKTIYLLFDELDYRVFLEETKNKVEGVELKNFEHLKETTLFFTDMRHTANNTNEAIPLITTGYKTTAITTASKNDLNIDSIGLWSESNHIFRIFKNATQRISIIGDYHPYCRIFHEFTDHCGYRHKKQTLGGILTIMLIETLPSSLIPIKKRASHIQNHQKIEQETLNALRSDNLDFIFVHHPYLPHFPIIYDAKSQQYNYSLYSSVAERIIHRIRGDETKLDYADNLQLTDVFVEKVLRVLKEEDIWDTSTLVIGTDHRWRLPDDGKLFDNVPFLIKLPMQTTGHQYHKKIDLTKVKPILEQIAIKRNNTVEGLSAWLDANNDE